MKVLEYCHFLFIALALSIFNFDIYPAPESISFAFQGAWGVLTSIVSGCLVGCYLGNQVFSE